MEGAGLRAGSFLFARRARPSSGQKRGKALEAPNRQEVQTSNSIDPFER
jgi:hypothetical protein